MHTHENKTPQPPEIPAHLMRAYDMNIPPIPTDSCQQHSLSPHKEPPLFTIKDKLIFLAIFVGIATVVIGLELLCIWMGWPTPTEILSEIFLAILVLIGFPYMVIQALFNS